MSEGNKAVVGRLTRAFNEGNRDLLDEIVAPSFVGHNSLSPQDIQGPAGLKGFFAAFRAAMPDIQHPSWTLIGEGDLVAIHMPIEGLLFHTTELGFCLVGQNAKSRGGYNGKSNQVEPKAMGGAVGAHHRTRPAVPRGPAVGIAGRDPGPRWPRHAMRGPGHRQ